MTCRVTTLTGTSDYTLAGGQVQKDTSVYANGDFYYDLATTSMTDAQIGRVVYAWIGTGAVPAAEVNVFILVNEKTG